jgi:hypothetical protein
LDRQPWAEVAASLADGVESSPRRLTKRLTNCLILLDTRRKPAARIPFLTSTNRH